jgi:pyrroloquinoline quinone biosynthesis protein B
VAISGDGRSWFLVNASPDLARQIETTPVLQPRHGRSRSSPVVSILLTNADLDHALGLLSLRQQPEPIVVYANERIRAALEWLDAITGRFCGIEWRDPDGASLGESLYVREIKLKHSGALQVQDTRTRGRILIAPTVGEVNDELCEALKNSEVVMFDGTFWSDDELRVVRPRARSAREMHHLPINGGSLDLLRGSTARRKIYVHINNTNPILMPGSRERHAVEKTGVEIGYDGLELNL